MFKYCLKMTYLPCNFTANWHLKWFRLGIYYGANLFFGANSTIGADSSLESAPPLALFLNGIGGSGSSLNLESPQLYCTLRSIQKVVIFCTGCWSGTLAAVQPHWMLELLRKNNTKHRERSDATQCRIHQKFNSLVAWYRPLACSQRNFGIWL